eukprot:TRINITY_DN2971_c0_g1_i8.p1 TRINITY_DN2971_c0_g1~~TRINITY_DN2971_c0_g1_i8.p1  ORF type:complete len:359 (+),score=18.12 TRINITY_DN2971_c0_g1_i8:279-1355(+)
MSACKTIPTEKLSCPQVALDVFSEFHALRTVSGHESIVNIIDSSFDELGAHLILELCTGGTVYDFLVGHPFLEEHQVGYFALQLLLALKHCHDLGIVHRDLKPENILLESECTPCVSRIPCRLCLDHRDAYPRERPVCLSTTRLKLADFGYATALSKHKPYASGLYGSALYMAPEIILGDKYGTAADMWSLGVICFTALSGNMPFNGSNEAQTLQRTLEGRPSFDSGRWPIRSTLAKDFVSRLLRADPIERLTATDAFLHPWITQTAMYLAEDEHSSVGALHQDDLSALEDSNSYAGSNAFPSFPKVSKFCADSDVSPQTETDTKSKRIISCVNLAGPHPLGKLKSWTKQASQAVART